MDERPLLFKNRRDEHASNGGLIEIIWVLLGIFEAKIDKICIFTQLLKITCNYDPK